MSFFKLLVIAVLLQTGTWAQSASLEKVTLQLQWKFQFQFAGFIVAQEKGYYKDIGLDVEILEYHNSNTIKELEEGKIDYAINNSLLAFHEGKLNDVTLLATYFQRSPLVIITQPEIESVLDLKGKKVMMSENNRYNSSLSILLNYFNISSQNTTFIKPSFDINDFIERKVDAFTVFRSNELYQLNQKHIPYKIIDPVEHGFSTNAINLFASQEKVAKNPQQVKDFLSATRKGWEYALSNINEVARLIHTNYRPDLTVEHLAYEGKVTRELMLTDLYAIGEINKEFMLKTFSQLLRSRKLDANQSREMLWFNGDTKIVSGTNVTLTAEEKLWIKNNPYITFTGDPNWLPYEAFDSDGNYAGIVSEHLKLIEESAGLHFKPLPVSSWTESLETAMRGDVKVISGDAADTILNKKFNPVQAYSQNPIVIIMRNNQHYVEHLESIADKKIASIKDYGYTADIFRRYPDIDFIEVENIQEGLNGVTEKRFDALLATMALATYTMVDMNLHNLKVVGKTPIIMDLTLFVAKDYKVSMMNNAARKMMDIGNIADLMYPKYYELSHHESEACDSKLHPCPLTEAMQTGNNTKVIHTHYDHDGNEKIVELYATPLKNEEDSVYGIIETAHDITALMHAKQDLQHQAEHDVLTGLPNRQLFLDRLGQSIKHAKRSKKQLAVLFLDLDHFKEVNDSLGHHVGDKLLLLIARHLEQNIRQSDTVARLGGDEFTIIIEDVVSMETVMDIIQKLMQSMSEPKVIDERQLYVTFSIGIAMYPDDAIKRLNELKKLGVSLAIDDFGTGYSSLSYLKQLPIDKLKIDRSFVRDIPDDPDDIEITRTIIAMAHGLHLEVIAEGVETQEQRDFLIENGCTELQGFLYHKPASASEIEKSLKEIVQG